MITRMQNVHDLNCQDDHQTAARFAGRYSDTQFQVFAAIDHVFEYVIDGVLMHPGAIGNYLTHLPAYATDKTGGGWFGTMARIVGKNATQITIVNCGPIKIVTLTLAPVMFTQGDAY